MNFLLDVFATIPDTLAAFILFANKTSSFWAPILLALIALTTFVHYRRALFVSKLSRIVLEIKIPKEVFKSPAAMEIILNGVFWQTGGGHDAHWYDKYYTGKVRSWFSLELVSIEGKVHFLIWTEKKFKPLIEAQFYAQYPEVEIREVPDYVQNVPYGAEGSNWELFGTEFKMGSKLGDPLPIKTYIDLGLHKDPKEEYKMDPMTPLIELLGALGKNEQMWFQILIMGTKGPYKSELGLLKTQTRDWRKETQELLAKMRNEFKEQNAGKGADATTKAFAMTTDEQKRIIENIERIMRKNGFETVVRLLYLAKKENFRGTLIGGVLGSLKQFASEGLNGFAPTSFTAVDYWFQDIKWLRHIPFLKDTLGKNMPGLKTEIFNNYIRRRMVYSNGASEPFILTTEELATLWHIPGQVAERPTFERIQSKRSEPPANLPL